eukprot:CAMPEP_0171051948 /NCGR_PEP_ID=MMETSP0736-20130129/53450_1 /TAXON_ID=186038 /ORGANISM="Fragilariopsis kerguelensis, Strain L26-C5" /LENGTH=173 /DNA_ID=CAMNT_0011505309 /DNA_START=11 /DNA_END=528 /DNA_ORIENTATION=-
MEMIYSGNDDYEPITAARTSDNDETDVLGTGAEKQRKPKLKKNKIDMLSLFKKNVICPIEELVMEPIIDDDINIMLSFSNESKSISCRQVPSDNDDMALLLSKMEESNSDIKVLLLEEIKKTNVRLDETENELRTNNAKLDTIQKSQQNMSMNTKSIIMIITMMIIITTIVLL